MVAVTRQVPGPFSSGPWAQTGDSRPGESSGGGPWGMIRDPSSSGSSSDAHRHAPGARAADRSTSFLRIGVEGLTLATPTWRLVAKLIDVVLLGAAMAPGVVLFSAYSEPLGVSIMLLGALTISALQWRLTVAGGQSLGKKWTGLRIVSDQGREVGLVEAVAKRVWVLWLGVALSGGLLMLIDLLLIFSKRRQCLHDRVAHTLVIEAGSPGDPHSN